MGYGLGASFGAKMGMPDKTVVNVAGDGCFRMPDIVDSYLLYICVFATSYHLV